MHRKLLLLARDARLPLLITVLSGLLAGLLTIGQSYLLSATISDVFLKNHALQQVWPWMRALLAIIAAKAALAWVNETAANRVAVRIKTDLRQRLFGHILALGPAYTRGQRTGELTAAAVDGIEALDAYFGQYLPQLVVSTLVPLSILALVFPLDPLSGLVLLLTAPLIPFFMYMIGRGAEAVTKRQYETLSRLSAHFLDSLQGLTTLKVFGQAKAQARNIAAVSDQYRDTTLKVLQVTFLSAFALELLATISTAIIAVEVGLRLLYGQMQFQEALFLLILAPEFYLPLRMLGMRFHAGMAGTSAARKIYEILDTPVPSAGRQSAATSGQISRTGERTPFGSLEFLDVSFNYPGESRPALHNIRLKVGRGQHLALVGASGAGKTTLASLLLRFIEPTSGEIRVDGKPMSQIPVDAWRETVAWVPQRPYLFHDTIEANIRLGKPDASEQEVRRAARAAHLDEFIATLPDGYTTVIGEAGARLSSGQGQRLALARAFLKDAPILILDEPTSSLDPETETLLEESTRELMRGRTIITIAHRLNTVAEADLIVVIEEGRIAEIGTHASLVQAAGPYARMVQAQRKGLESRSHWLQGDQATWAARESGEDAEAPSYAVPGNAGREPEAQKTAAILLRLLSFLRGSWGWVVLSIVLSSLTVGASVALMGTSSWLISMAALHPSIAVLEVAIVGVRFFGIARAVFRYLERLVSHNVTFQLLGRLRVWFYERLELLAPARLLDYRAGDLLARIIGDVGVLENFYVRVLAPPATAILVCMGTSFFLAFTDGRLMLILLGSFLIVGVALPVVVHRLSKQAGSAVVAERADLNVQLVDGIQGLADLLAFGQGQQRLRRADESSRHYGRSQRQLASVNGLQGAVYTFVTNFAPWLMLLILIPEVAAGHLAAVMLAPLILLTAASFEAVSPLPLAAQTWSSARAAAQRLFDVVDTQPEVREPGSVGARPGSELAGTGVVEFRNVSFAYPGQPVAAVADLSFRLEPGQKLAMVGPSGAGKSTVASLLLRFWEYGRGEICLNGRSLRDYTPDEVREHIAFVSPNTYFFNTSVYENLRMARRRVSREEVEQAARSAQIHDFIVKLPKGYDTLIGEQGLRLSPGERQRLAIARAVLKDAPILLLDEPTANLDAVNEAQILANLFQLMQSKASLLITHRLIGLENMDRILVMEHGRMAESGTQAELLDRHGPFRRLWELQNRFIAEA